MQNGRNLFNRVKINGKPLWAAVRNPSADLELATLHKMLELMHIKTGLVAAYGPDYPLVEPRELIPSFDAPFIEYRDLPAYSMAVFDRALSYQDEGFQYDRLSPEPHPVDPAVAANNRQLFKDRLPRDQVPEFEKSLGRRPITSLDRYMWVLPYLFKMDRGHVLARDERGAFHLAGIYASFPSDLDGEIKRFGARIGKFKKGDNAQYAANRLFVYRFLMEQSGLPICGERHTSAALFARRLWRRRERFIVKVLGTSDRTITSYTNPGITGVPPQVEKYALVSAEGCTSDGADFLHKNGFLLDQERRVVILRVRYQHHRYHPDNVLEDRALSVASQQVIHPRTGQTVELDILGISRDRLVELNDIVRGEHQGTIVYQGREQIEGTSDTKNRLKFLLAWMEKHRRLLAEYSPDHFELTLKVLNSYLDDPEKQAELARNTDLLEQVKKLIVELRLEHRLRRLEKMVRRRADAGGRKLQHVHVLIILVHVLSQEGEKLATEHPRGLDKLLKICKQQLANPYLRKRYLSREPKTTRDREVLGEYRLLERLVERMESLRND